MNLFFLWSDVRPNRLLGDDLFLSLACALAGAAGCLPRRGWLFAEEEKNKVQQTGFFFDSSLAFCRARPADSAQLGSSLPDFLNPREFAARLKRSCAFGASFSPKILLLKNEKTFQFRAQV